MMCPHETHHLFYINASSIQGKRIMRFAPLDNLLSQSVSRLHHQLIAIDGAEC